MSLFDNEKNENELKTPYNIEAEEALLGSIFLKPDVISDVIDIISPSDFYKYNYELIFLEMLKIYNSGKIIDTLIIINSLENTNKLEKIGGEDIIYDLTEVVPTAANAISYAQIIKECSIRRSLINTGEKIARNSYIGYYKVDKMLDEAEKLLFEIVKKKQIKDVITLEEMSTKKLQSLDKMSKFQGGLRGIDSGFKGYNFLTGGFHGSDLIILAARPAMGKTAFALNLALNVAKSGKHVLIFSLEMGNEQLFDRLVSMESMIKLKKIKDGNIKVDEYTVLANSMGKLSKLPLYISDSSSVNIFEIKSVARKLKAEGKLDFMLIDYLQLINPSEGSRKNREQEISEISRSLKIIAKELNIPIVTLSQLSRGVESRTDKRPILSDLRESGAIEQDADMVMFLYREKYYMKDNLSSNINNAIPQQYTNYSQQNNGDSDVEIVEVIIGKHRSGPTGTIELAFRPSCQKFLDIVTKNQEERYKN